jgi:glycerol-3-phosphate dehydrogenase (NAD(P)+)
MIAVVGAGSWGTALAIHLARGGATVRVCARTAAVAEAITKRRRNPWYLSDLEIPPGVEATSDPATALAGADVVIVAVPSEFFGATLARLIPPAGAAVVSATKGFDPTRHLRMSELVRERFPAAPLAVLSGPTFAREVAMALPTAAVIAAADDALATDLQARLRSRELRLYTNRDLVGVEAGGALKNVMAIATRGLAEMTRLAVALGGEPSTLAGLAGLGDLVLTATGTLSRNRALGMALARGDSPARIAASTRMVAEGVPTVRTALALAAVHHVSMPICGEVAAVLFDQKAPAEALASLLGRAATREDLATGGRRA